MSSLRSITLATLTKDIRLEWRSRDAINSMLFFSLLVVVIFSFSFDPNAEESREIAGGLIWVAFLFAAVVALNQTWARELRNQVLDAYRVSPAPANSLFVAKALGNFILVTVLEAVMAPLFMIFYNLRVAGSGVAVDSGGDSGNVGAGGQRNVFCGDVVAHTQPRNYVAAVVVPHLDPSRAVDGGGYAHHSFRGRLGALLDRIASHLRCGVYYSLSGIV